MATELANSATASGSRTSPIPRLRLSRQNLFSHDNNTAASSSRFPGVPLSSELPEHPQHDEDNQSTPRLSAANLLNSPLDDVSSLATPAARLRALLSKVPNHDSSASPSTSTSLRNENTAGNDGNRQATPSIVRDSLKDIFTRALREPGDTPRKQQRRRNSIDASDLESSPHVDSHWTKAHSKRISLSDEEVENLSKSSRRSESSFKSQATTFEHLRQRLTNSRTQLLDEVPPSLQSSDLNAHESHETARILRDLNSSHTPPAATSTPPQQSLRMSTTSQFGFHSNLLDQDSDMQRAINDFDSYEDQSSLNQRPLSFPPARPSHATPPPRTQSPSRPDSKVDSPKRFSGDFTRSTSRASSSQSTNNHSLDEHTAHKTKPKWNQPQPKTPVRPHSPDCHVHPRRNASTAESETKLSRRRSTASIQSLDGHSSQGSFGSYSEYRERIDELDRDGHAEQQHTWNRPISSLSRQGSSSSLQKQSERTRTLSHPTRPDSAHSFNHPQRTRHDSVSSSRSTSSVGSRSNHKAQGSDADDVMEAARYERERNWNAPRPQWRHHPSTPHVTSFPRSRSPMPPSPSPSSSSSRARPSSTERPRAQSLRNSPKVGSPVHHKPATPAAHHLAVGKSPARAISPSPSIISSPASLLAPKGRPSPRSRSPIPSFEHHQPQSTPGDSSRSHKPLAPLLDKLSPREGASTPPSTLANVSQLSGPADGSQRHSRNLGSQKLSHIPRWSPHKLGHTAAARISTDLEQSSSAVEPPSITVHIVPSDDETVETESDEDDLAHERTPTLRTVAPPLEDSPELSDLRTPLAIHAPQLPLPTQHDEDLPSSSNKMENSVLPSPPAESPSEPPTVPSFLATPPRRLFANAKLEFQTPSPPKGLPELPGPPSSSEDGDTDVEQHPITPLRRPLDPLLLKTPRPPGGWSTTPAVERTAVPHSQSFSNEGQDVLQENGLATPVASLSRATSLPLQTPAPPGAWTATPASRRSILKVRFESGRSPGDATDSTDPNASLNGEALQESTSGTVTPRDDESSLPTPQTPVAQPRSPRKSPAVRMMDAYGREIRPKDEPSPSKNASTSKGGEPSKQSSPKNTPRTQARIRMLDAMGREIDQSTEKDKSITKENEPPHSHNEALVRVRQGLSDLAETLSDLSSSKVDLKLDPEQLNDLDTVSKAARETRVQLSHSLQSAQANMRTQLTFRESLRNAAYFRGLSRSRLFLYFLCVQFVLALFMYRLSILHTRELFLTTYYDPFYSDLYLYTIKPDTSHYMASSTATSTLWSIGLDWNLASRFWSR